MANKSRSCPWGTLYNGVREDACTFTTPIVTLMSAASSRGRLPGTPPDDKGRYDIVQEDAKRDKKAALVKDLVDRTMAEHQAFCANGTPSIPNMKRAAAVAGMQEKDIANMLNVRNGKTGQGWTDLQKWQVYYCLWMYLFCNRQKGLEDRVAGICDQGVIPSLKSGEGSKGGEGSEGGKAQLMLCGIPKDLADAAARGRTATKGGLSIGGVKKILAANGVKLDGNGDDQRKQLKDLLDGETAPTRPDIPPDLRELIRNSVLHDQNKTNGGLNVDGLKGACRQLGIPQTGVRDDLRARLAIVEELKLPEDESDDAVSESSFDDSGSASSF